LYDSDYRRDFEPGIEGKLTLPAQQNAFGEARPDVLRDVGVEAPIPSTVVLRWPIDPRRPLVFELLSPGKLSLVKFSALGSSSL